MPSIQLTQKSVKEYTCPIGGKTIRLCDKVVTGLGLVVQITGSKSYDLRYKDKRGIERQKKLGSFNTITLAEARKLAQIMKKGLIMGHDPLEEQKALKKALTFQQLVDDYYLPHAKVYKKSWRGDVGNLNKHILPILGKKYLDEITYRDIEQVVQTRIEGGGAMGSANLSLILVRHIFNLAIELWKITGVTENPTKCVKLLKVDNQKTRFLTPNELDRLYRSVSNSKCKMLKYIFAILVLTGARKNEALKAKWTDIDLEKYQWTIPQAKTGLRYIEIGETAVTLLQSLKALQLSDVYVFPNPQTNKPYESITQPWVTARTAANLSGVRLHDLRHTFASLLINGGRTLYEVQQLLGHSTSKTTQRYAHLEKRTLQAATNVAGHSIGHLLTSLPTHERRVSLGVHSP